jgi:hypothetical protein
MSQRNVSRVGAGASQQRTPPQAPTSACDACLIAFLLPPASATFPVGAPGGDGSVPIARRLPAPYSVSPAARALPSSPSPVPFPTLSPACRLQVPCDMPDDMLRFCIDLARSKLEGIADWQAEGDGVLTAMKDALDAAYGGGAQWHVVVGKRFGAKVTHVATAYVFFYTGDKAVCMFRC